MLRRSGTPQRWQAAPQLGLGTKRPPVSAPPGGRDGRNGAFGPRHCRGYEGPVNGSVSTDRERRTDAERSSEQSRQAVSSSQHGNSTLMAGGCSCGSPGAFRRALRLHGYWPSSLALAARSASTLRPRRSLCVRSAMLSWLAMSVRANSPSAASNFRRWAHRYLAAGCARRGRACDR